MVLYVMFVYTVEAVNFLTKPLKFIGSNCKYANCFSSRVQLCDHNLKNLDIWHGIIYEIQVFLFIYMPQFCIEILLHKQG